MAIFSDPFKELVNQLLIKHGSNGLPMSNRTANRLTGISTTAINNLANGMITTDEIIRKFADGLKEPRTPLLKASVKYQPTAEDLEHDRQLIRDQAKKEGKPRLQALREAGIDPEMKDYAYDQHHFGSTELPEPLEEVLRPFAKEGRVIPLSDFPLLEGHLPMGSGEAWESQKNSRAGIATIYAKGDSMEPTYGDGDLILFRAFSGVPRRREVYIIWTDDEGNTCKRYMGTEQDEDGEVYHIFAPDNPKYGTIRVRAEDVVFQGIPLTSIPRKELETADKLFWGRR
jgi:hypothetical protein